MNFSLVKKNLYILNDMETLFEFVKLHTLKYLHYLLRKKINKNDMLRSL